MPERRHRAPALNPAFEALHPRDRKGHDRGQFVDVHAAMLRMGADWDEPNQVWLVPTDRRKDFEEFLEEAGFDAVRVPEGMRPVTEADYEQRWGVRGKIPPGWSHVVVNDDPDAKVLVVGRDAKGREQRIYSKAHTEAKAAEKFDRIKQFNARMEDVDVALSEQAMNDDTAAAVMLIRKMGLRPGSRTDTRAEKQAYGATTLQRRHVSVSGDRVRLQFVGKEGIDLDLEITDRELARTLKHRLQGKDGHEPLFNTSASKANRWLQDHAGESFTLKDFRTRLGTAEAAAMIKDMPVPETEKERKKAIREVGKAISEVLGNTPKMALDSYIDPRVFDVWPEEF